MSAVTGLAAEAAAFMERAADSSSSRSGYQRIWDQFGRYCTASGVRVPDRETAAGFCAAVGADGAGQWQVFYRRAVGCLFDVADTARRFALRAGRGGNAPAGERNQPHLHPRHPRTRVHRHHRGLRQGQPRDETPRHRNRRQQDPRTKPLPRCLPTGPADLAPPSHLSSRYAKKPGPAERLTSTDTTNFT